MLGKNVIVLTVFEGKDKPYQVKDKGFYLRMQGTNRLMTRYELDEIYRSSSGDWPKRTGNEEGKVSRKRSTF